MGKGGRIFDVHGNQPKAHYSFPSLVFISHLLFSLLPHAVVGQYPSRCACLRELHIAGNPETATNPIDTIAS